MVSFNFNIVIGVVFIVYLLWSCMWNEEVKGHPFNYLFRVIACKALFEVMMLMNSLAQELKPEIDKTT